MKTARQTCSLLLVLGTFLLGASATRAHLPHPIQASGTVAFVDRETQTLVFKMPQKKPFVLDWDKDTQFVKNGVVTNAMALLSGTAAIIHYKNLSFRNPLLKKVLLGTEGEKP
ncbi:MAG: hypothetical protein HY674_09725 [Chloroflexi bacterium]|nr:hypothetical protein [Chloroflexota bacterium]